MASFSYDKALILEKLREKRDLLKEEIEHADHTQAVLVSDYAEAFADRVREWYKTFNVERYIADRGRLGVSSPPYWSPPHDFRATQTMKLKQIEDAICRLDLVIDVKGAIRISDNDYAWTWILDRAVEKAEDVNPVE